MAGDINLNAAWCIAVDCSTMASFGDPSDGLVLMRLFPMYIEQLPVRELFYNQDRKENDIV